MSFGIEFDIDADEYEEHGEGPRQTGDASSTSEEPSAAPSGHDDGDATTGAKPANQATEHKFDKLFELTDSLREAERDRLMRHWASIRVEAQDDNPHLGDASDSHDSTPEDCDEPEEPAPNAPVANPIDVASGEKPQSADGDSEEPSTDATSESDMGQAGDVTPERKGMRCDWMAMLALSLSGLSVMFALMPIIGRVLWIVPAIPAVILALLATLMRNGRGRSPLVCAIALLLVICSVALSFVADAMYHEQDVISVTDGRRQELSLSD